VSASATCGGLHCLAFWRVMTFSKRRMPRCRTSWFSKVVVWYADAPKACDNVAERSLYESLSWNRSCELVTAAARIAERLHFFLLSFPAKIVAADFAPALCQIKSLRQRSAPRSEIFFTCSVLRPRKARIRARWLFRRVPLGTADGDGLHRLTPHRRGCAECHGVVSIIQDMVLQGRNIRCGNIHGRPISVRISLA